MVTLFETQGPSAYGGYIYLKSDVSPISLSTPINVETNQGFSTACNSAFYFMSSTNFKFFAIFGSQPTLTNPGDLTINLKQSGNYWYAYGELVTFRNQAPLREGVLTVFDNNTDYVDFIMAPVQYAGGAGSGYIGNSRLSNKKMVGYNVPTSSADDTKTESVNEASATPTANKPKIGNGFARIKFLRDYVSNFPIVMSNAILLPPDDMVVNLYRRGDSTIADVYTTFDSRSDTCALIWDSVQNAYLIYRFSNASRDAFYFGSMDFITGSGGTNNSYGFNAETNDLWPTDGYGTNVGHVRFNAHSGNVTYYDLCSHFTYDGEHPVIVCSKLEQRPVYLDEVYFDDYVHL